MNVHRVSMSQSEMKDQGPRPRPVKAVWVPGPPSGVGCLWAGKNQRVLGTFLGSSKAPGSRSPCAHSITAGNRAGARHLGVGGSGGAKLWRLPGPQDPRSDPATPWHQTWPLPSLVKAWPREEGETEAQRGWGCPSQAQHRPRAAAPARGPGGATHLLRSLPPLGTSHTCTCGGSFMPRGWCRRARVARPVRPRARKGALWGFSPVAAQDPRSDPSFSAGQLQGLGKRCYRLCLSLLTCRLVQEPRKGSGAHTQQNAASGETGPLIRRFRVTRARLLPRKLCVPELGADPVVRAQSRSGGLHARVGSYRKPLGLALFPYL